MLNDAPPPFAARIVTSGQRLFARDREQDHVFIRDVQLLAADIAPWLERMRRIKLQALQR